MRCFQQEVFKLKKKEKNNLLLQAGWVISADLLFAQYNTSNKIPVQ